MAPPPRGTSAGGAATPAAAAAEPPEAPSKLLIYTANLTLAVFEVRKVLDDVEALGNELGGYLLQRAERLVTIRIPAPRFKDAVDRIAKLGDVLRQDVQAQDVTDQMFDLEVRIRNARAVRDRLEKLLANAHAVKDALEVERELSRLGEEIERLEGQKKRLSELVAFSTVTVSLQAPTPPQVGTKVVLPFPWLKTLGLSQLLRLDR